MVTKYYKHCLGQCYYNQGTVWKSLESGWASPANNDPWFHMFCKWIHEFKWLNSRVSVHEFTGFCEQICCVDTCLPWNHEFFTWWHVPVKLYQFWPTMTRVKLVQNSWQRADHMYSREYTWKQVLVERNQLWTSMTRANWFRSGSLFPGST